MLELGRYLNYLHTVKLTDWTFDFESDTSAQHWKLFSNKIKAYQSLWDK